MADVKSTGPSTATIILIAVLATPVVLVVIFWLIGSGSADAKTNLPDLHSKGLQWATTEAKSAGFGDIETHDAWAGTAAGGTTRTGWSASRSRPRAASASRAPW